MNKPVLSPDFTIEYIHNLRVFIDYPTKDMKPQERLNYQNNRGLEIHKLIQERKLQKT